MGICINVLVAVNVCRVVLGGIMQCVCMFIYIMIGIIDWARMDSC